jgi:hypothetical protein
VDEPTLSTEELFLVLYCTIDELYQEAAPDCVQSRPGSDRLEMSDAEVITLSVMQEGRSNDSELSFHCFPTSSVARATTGGGRT